MVSSKWSPSAMGVESTPVSTRSPALVMHHHCFWPLWAAVVLLLKRGGERPVLFWAAANGAFGLSFGALCALPYLAGGPWAAFSYSVITAASRAHSTTWRLAVRRLFPPMPFNRWTW